MPLDLFVWASVVLMMFIGIVMSTENMRSLLLLRVAPITVAIGLAVTWALERGYIINIGV